MTSPNNTTVAATRSPHRPHSQRSSSSGGGGGSKKDSKSSTNRWQRPGGDDSSSSAVSSGASNAAVVTTTRSRSPPVVTIAPTLSLSGLSHYQQHDSRKVRQPTFIIIIIVLFIYFWACSLLPSPFRLTIGLQCYATRYLHCHLAVVVQMDYLLVVSARDCRLYPTALIIHIRLLH